MEEISAHTEDTREIKILVRSMRRRITECITQYSQKHAHITFKIIFDYDDDRYQDYAIIIDTEKDLYGDFERIELFNMRLRLVCSAASPLCQKNGHSAGCVTNRLSPWGPKVTCRKFWKKPATA